MICFLPSIAARITLRRWVAISLEKLSENGNTAALSDNTAPALPKRILKFTVIFFLRHNRFGQTKKNAARNFRAQIERECDSVRTVGARQKDAFPRFGCRAETDRVPSSMESFGLFLCVCFVSCVSC
jgi:hypothetical protein